MCSWTARLSLPKSTSGNIVRERLSLSTQENARFCAEALKKRRIDCAIIVTCEWHLPRAVALFRREGLRVEGCAAPDSQAGVALRVWRWGRERAASRFDGLES